MSANTRNTQARDEDGFSLVELVIAVALTIVVMGAVFGLLTRGQRSFNREPQVADLNQSARVGLDMISRDLTIAGYKTPGASALIWTDGGGINPDEITIVYADPDIPTSIPLQCGIAGVGGGGGPCGTINNSSTLYLNPDSLDPHIADATQAYDVGMILSALETSDCNNDGQTGIYPFELTQPPSMTSAGGLPTLQINHNPGADPSGLNLPGGFNREVHPDCAIVGFFRIIQYRISPLPPTANPLLERRDLSIVQPWTPVANNIENLQFQYATALNDMVDSPPIPFQDDPLTWVNRVRVTVSGRTESTNLEGASVGPFSADDTHLRKTFSTAVSLRNLSFQAGVVSSALTYN
jgi:type II secretory pathway pseudopilin PulG